MSSKRGSAIITAMFAIVIVALIAAGINELIHYINRLNQISHVKSIAFQIESGILTRLLDSQNYDPATGELDITKFDPNNLLIPGMFRPVLGAKCAIPAGCGVQVRAGALGPRWNSATRTFSAIVDYTGTDFTMKPIEINLQVPPANLLPPSVSCPDATPFFSGVDNSNTPICRAMSCPPGEVAISYDPDTRALYCMKPRIAECTTPEKPLLVWRQAYNTPNPGAPASPTAPAFASSGGWTTHYCAPPFDPFTAWGGP